MLTMKLAGLLIVTTLALACSKSVRVPPNEYGNPGSSAAYVVRTIDGAEFSVARYSIADSMLVVEEWSRSTKRVGGVPPTPLAIPVRDIESIDRILLDRDKASGWLLGFGVGLLALAILAASAQVM